MDTSSLKMSVLFFCYIHSKEEAEGRCLAISDFFKKIKCNFTGTLFHIDTI